MRDILLWFHQEVYSIMVLLFFWVLVLYALTFYVLLFLLFTNTDVLAPIMTLSPSGLIFSAEFCLLLGLICRARGFDTIHLKSMMGSCIECHDWALSPRFSTRMYCPALVSSAVSCRYRMFFILLFILVFNNLFVSHCY